MLRIQCSVLPTHFHYYNLSEYQDTNNVVCCFVHFRTTSVWIATFVAIQFGSHWTAHKMIILHAPNTSLHLALRQIKFINSYRVTSRQECHAMWIIVWHSSVQYILFNLIRNIFYILFLYLAIIPWSCVWRGTVYRMPWTFNLAQNRSNQLTTVTALTFKILVAMNKTLW